MVVAMMMLGIAVTWTDWTRWVIPNRLLAIAAIGFLWWRFFGHGIWVGLAGGILLGGIGLLGSVLSRDSLGMGDVKYLAVLGLALGPSIGLMCLMLASTAGVLFATARSVVKRVPLNRAFPFGPFLAAASVASAIFSSHLG